MLLEVTLAKTHNILGLKGSKILINNEYIIAIREDTSNGNAILFLDLSDLKSFTEVYIEEPYIKWWYTIRVNP